MLALRERDEVLPIHIAFRTDRAGVEGRVGGQEGTAVGGDRIEHRQELVGVRDDGEELRRTIALG